MSEPAERGSERGSFWTSVPGILSAIAGVLGAIAAVLGALATLGVFSGSDSPEPPTETETAQIRRASLDRVQLRWRANVVSGGVRFSRVTVSALPAGSRLEVRCEGSATCFDGWRRMVVVEPQPKLSVLRIFPRRLTSGATLNVRAAVPRAGSKTWKIVEDGYDTATAEEFCRPLDEPVAYAC